MRGAVLLAAYLGLTMGIAGCSAVHPPATASRTEALMGRVDWGPPRQHGQTAQALTTDVANGATVSLIETGSGKTVSTAVSSDDGMFNLTFPSSFMWEKGKPYYLEAVKGLPVGGAANRAGAALARVRTLVASDGPLSWSSFSETGLIIISRGTTALSIIAGYRDLPVADQVALFGKVTGNSFAASGTAIAPEDFDRVFALVSDALLEDQDPVESIGYFASGTTAAQRYGRKAGTMALHASLSPAIASIGQPVTITGQNFPGPGPATPSIRLGRSDVTSWSVGEDRTRLTMTVPTGAFSGFLQISQGSATWTGPLVPVAGTAATLAGTGTWGFRDGPGAKAQFYLNMGIALGPDGTLYVGDCDNYRLRKVAPDGTVSTLAGRPEPGFADGSDPSFSCPAGLAMTAAGQIVVADLGNHSIRLVAPSGYTTTLAGNGTPGYAEGTGAQASFKVPYSVATDTAGNVYVADASNHRIRMITPAGVTSTLAGTGTAGFADGAASSAEFNRPAAVAVAPNGDVYVGDRMNHRIRRVSATTGQVSTVAGSGAAGFADGPAATAQFNLPVGVTVDEAGNVYVADYRNQRIRKVTPSGMVSTVAGTGDGGLQDGPLATAKLNRPFQMAFDARGVMYVSELFNSVVRVIVP